MVNPGEYVEVEDTATLRANLSHLLQFGALALDKLPPPYVMERQRADASAGKLAAHIGQRVDVKETSVAGEGPPSPPVSGSTVTLSKSDPTSAESDVLPAPPVAEDPPPLQPPKKNRPR